MYSFGVFGLVDCPASAPSVFWGHFELLVPWPWAFGLMDSRLLGLSVYNRIISEVLIRYKKKTIN